MPILTAAHDGEGQPTSVYSLADEGAGAVNPAQSVGQEAAMTVAPGGDERGAMTSAPLKEPWGSGYERQCAGKDAYPSEAGAAAALKLLQREGRLRSGSGLQVYRCRYCGEWHFGHG